MSFAVYLPVAGTAVNVFILIGLGAAVGFLSGLFGVGGGFLMTPLLIMIGVPPTVAAASDSNQIVAASASGTYAHALAGSVDYKMGLLLLLGSVCGSSLGVLIIEALLATGQADLLINVAYVLMLASIGSYMFFESLFALRGKTARRQATEVRPSVYSRIVRALPGRLQFRRSNVTVSFLVPVFLGVVVGILAAIMGVGGGFIMVPIMVYLLRMPMHVVVGTSLFQILLTCIHVTIMQAAVNHTVDFVLALLLLVGSVFGAQLGVRAGRYLNPNQLRILMAIIVLCVMVKILLSLTLTPNILVDYKGGH